MFAKRIIPCLDVKNGRVVKGVSFVDLVDAGDPVECAAAYGKMGADELVFLDITATVEGRKTTIDMVKRVANTIFIPFTVGGGIRRCEDFCRAAQGRRRQGVGKFLGGENPALISEAAERFGSQCVVCAIDTRRKQGGGFEVYLDGGRTPTGIDAVEWARKAALLGAGEILLTSMDCDGQKNGYDIELTRLVSDAVGVPVIASGGAGKKEHFYDALTVGGADAALAASLFHFKELSLGELKEYLKLRGVSVRI